MTAEGGLAICLVNKTGGNSVKGEAVNADTSADKAFKQSAIDAYDVIGAVYEAGIAADGLCWVVISGQADVLLKDGTTSTRGNWLGMSDTAGRFNASGGVPSPPTDAQHFRECGHVLETKGSGTSVLARSALHFN